VKNLRVLATWEYISIIKSKCVNYVFSTLLFLPPLKFLKGFLEFFLISKVLIQHGIICRPSDSPGVEGCWDRTQDCRVFDIDSETLEPLG